MITLKNRYLVAHFSPETGGMIHLSTAGESANVVRSTYCSYHERGSEKWYGDQGIRKEATPFEVVKVNATDGAFESIVRSPHIEVTQRFELSATSPLLRV